VLVATGDVVLVFQEDTVFEAISGQEWVFEVADFEREVTEYRNHGRLPASARAASEEQQGQQAGEAGPTRPSPRGTRPREKDWSRQAG
jgi:hypothetical protein